MDRRLSASANIILRARGYRIPTIGGVASLKLREDHLAAVDVLARRGPDRLAALERARRLGIDDDALESAAQDLAARGLLAAEDAPDERTAPRVAPPADPDTHLPTDTDELVAVVPITLHPGPGGVEVTLRHGTATFLDVRGLLLLGAFRHRTSLAEALAATRATHPEGGLSDAEAAELVATLVRHRVLRRPDDDPADGPQDARELLRHQEFARTRRFVEAAEARERRRPADAAGPDGRRRVSVLPIHDPIQQMNLALGMIFAYAQAYEGGRLRERYDLEPFWALRRSNLRRTLEARGPSIFLCSNYIWSRTANLELSRLVKELSPESLVIHGGPDTPRYESDTEAYLREHPYVDVAVRNAGEVATAELLAALDGELTGTDEDRARLTEVAGLSFLVGDRFVRTADRPRLADLDQLPSPYLTGIFDDYADGAAPMAIIETNRGCPYGCTFCDWGSATASRIRRFDLERTFAELEWLAKNKIDRAVIADANFGIMSRDVQIAERIAELKREYGYPNQVYLSYAKNTVKHIEKIVRIFVDAEVLPEGELALQTTDPDTLGTIRRENIQTEKYLTMAGLFRQEGLPMATEIMLGLPGSTPASVQADLQFCVDHEMPAKLYRTELLVNSPMNEPDYRGEHAVVAREASQLDTTEPYDEAAKRRRLLVVSTSSYDEADMDRMLALRNLFGLAENFGVLRHVARYVRRETGIAEMDFHVGLADTAARSPERYPTARWCLATLGEVATAPVTWSRFFDDVRAYLTGELGVADDDALETVLTVQQALIPDRDRTFPDDLTLPHDYAAWHNLMLGAKDLGRPWTAVVPPLRDLGPGTLRVTDPQNLCNTSIGRRIAFHHNGHWELDSVVSRVGRDPYYI